MAKQQQAMKKSTAVAVKKPNKTPARAGSSGGAVPAHLQGYESSGKGVPTDASDFIIPMARVLDPKAPECEKRGANYVPGAEPGDIYIKNAPVPIVKGEEGFLFQPCYRDQAVVEWLPRNKGGGGGGGYVARHPADFLTTSKDVIQRPHPEDPSKKVWVRKSTNNLLVETRYVGGYVLAEDEPAMPLVLPFASTGHTVAKNWNMLLASKRINGMQADIWLVAYRVRSRLKTRQDQSWYLFDITDAGDEDANGLPTTMWVPTPEDVERGRALYDALASGARQFEAGGEAPAEQSDDNKM